jgi:hypothetical protein
LIQEEIRFGQLIGYIVEHALSHRGSIHVGTAAPSFEACIGLAVPGQPIRSLVAEDRSAEGVGDRTGPKDAAAPRSRLADDAVVTEDELTMR